MRFLTVQEVQRFERAQQEGQMTVTVPLTGEELDELIADDLSVSLKVALVEGFPLSALIGRFGFVSDVFDGGDRLIVETVDGFVYFAQYDDASDNDQTILVTFV